MTHSALILELNQFAKPDTVNTVFGFCSFLIALITLILLVVYHKKIPPSFKPLAIGVIIIFGLLCTIYFSLWFFPLVASPVEAMKKTEEIRPNPSVVPKPSPTCPPLESVALSEDVVTVNGAVLAQPPEGYFGGRFTSDDPDIASIATGFRPTSGGVLVKANSAGIVNISASDLRHLNGAYPCRLAKTVLIVQEKEQETIQDAYPEQPDAAASVIPIPSPTIIPCRNDVVWKATNVKDSEVEFALEYKYCGGYRSFAPNFTVSVPSNYTGCFETKLDPYIISVGKGQVTGRIKLRDSMVISTSTILVCLNIPDQEPLCSQFAYFKEWEKKGILRRCFGILKKPFV